MNIPRKRAAQVCAAVAAVAVFLPWQTAAEQGADSMAGTATGDGRILFIACLITIGLIHAGWRPAWIGAGFSCAITVREILGLSGDGPPEPAAGLWIAAIASLAAVVLLVWDMFASVAAASSGADGDQPPGRRRLSGPLGRRPR